MVKLYFLLFLTFSLSAIGDETHSDFYDAMSEKDWSSAKVLVKKINEEDDLRLDKRENYYLGLYYGDINNPEYDIEKSIGYLESAYKLGSLEAGFLLSWGYVLTDNPKITDFNRGAEIAKDLVVIYERFVKNNMDEDGSISRSLGKYYIYGLGVKKDLDKGVFYIKKAAGMGDDEAKSIIQKSKENYE